MTPEQKLLLIQALEDFERKLQTVIFRLVHVETKLEELEFRVDCVE